MENTMITSAVNNPTFARPRALDLHATATTAGWAAMPVGASVPAYVSGAVNAGLRGAGLPVAGQRDAKATTGTNATNSTTATEGPPRGTPC